MERHQVFRFDHFLLDPDSFILYRDGKEVHLEPVVLRLLVHLVTHRDRLVTRQELMDSVWGDTVISESALSKAVARLRKVLGDNAVPHRYVATVHSRGFRFVAEVDESALPESSGAPRKGSRGLLAGASAIAVLILLAVLWIRAPGNDALRTDEIDSLAVLPLSNLTGDPEQDYYAGGLQDLLVTELSQLPGLRVTSRQSTKRYRNSQLPTTDIAGELGVDALVEGSLLRVGRTIEVTIQLIDGRSDEHLWAKRYTREAPYVFDLVSDMANAIGTEIGIGQVPHGPETPGRREFSPVDPRAIDAYALGIMYLDRYSPADVQSAIGQLRKAVDIESGFALAWGQLAVAHAMLGLYGYAPPRESIEKARAAALQAIEADDRFYIGHSTLGWARLWTGDVAGGCESFQEALRLNPSAPYAIHGDADCLMLEGQMDASVARVRELSVVGPFSAMHGRPLPYHLFLARRYDEAVAAVMATRARIPGLSMHYILAWVYWVEGQFDKALAEERLELERRGDTVLRAALEKGLEAGGPKGAMRAMAEALVARSDQAYVDPFEIGKTFARAGMADEALHWLDRAVDYGSYETTYLAFRPDFEFLHADPRFRELLERVHGQGVPGTRWPGDSN